MISKPPAKRTVKSMYFYLFKFTILLEYEVNFEYILHITHGKSLQWIFLQYIIHIWDMGAFEIIRLSVTLIKKHFL